MLLCVAMVASVSPNCVRAAPNKLSPFTLNLQARAFAIAVIDAVNSQGFIIPPHLHTNS